MCAFLTIDDQFWGQMWYVGHRVVWASSETTLGLPFDVP